MFKINILEKKQKKGSIPLPFRVFSVTSTPNWMMSPDIISHGGLSSDPLLSL